MRILLLYHPVRVNILRGWKPINIIILHKYYDAFGKLLWKTKIILPNLVMLVIKRT